MTVLVYCDRCGDPATEDLAMLADLKMPLKGLSASL